MTMLYKERKREEAEKNRKATKEIKKLQKSVVFPKGNSLREHLCRSLIAQDKIKICREFGIYDDCEKCRLNPLNT